jgi:NADPH:quinone reductase-like Zn-dependent oxidoreductase
VRTIVFERFGEPAEVLTLKEAPAPAPGRGQIRVKMLASPINPSDLLTIRGVYGRLPKLPATPGFEGVGIVTAAGGGWFAKYLVGKRVAVLNGITGNWRDETIIPARQAVPLAADLPVEQAAMFFVNPVTAYLMTREVLRVPAGAWLLQTAANSAVGHMVIRLGKKFGFRTLNVVRRAEQVAELTALGGDAAVHFDPREHSGERLHDEVRRITNGSFVKYAIDAVGGATGSAAASCLGSGGRLLSYGALADEPMSISPRTLITFGAIVEGFWLARWMTESGVLNKLRMVRRITQLMREGVLVSKVAATFPLEQIADAVRAAETPGRHGKVLLRIAEAGAGR